MIICGVDPGSRITGYGVVCAEGNQFRCLQFGAIRAATRRNEPFSERLKVIYSELCGLLRQFAPDVLVVEQIFHASNVKSALTLGQARGVVLLAAAEVEIPLIEYSPAEVKKSVAGHGRADKVQIQWMVKTLLNLSTVPEPNDAADALAIALCHAFQRTTQRHTQRRWRSLG